MTDVSRGASAGRETDCDASCLSPSGRPPQPLRVHGRANATEQQRTSITSRGVTRVRSEQGPKPVSVEHDAEGRTFELFSRSCPVCEVDDAKVLGLRGGPRQRYGRGICSRIVRCRQCGLIYPNPLPLPVDPDAIYADPESYFVRHEQEARLAEYRNLAQELRSRAKLEHPRVLDVGSGRGDFVYAARQEGLTEVTGVEFAAAMVDHAKANLGVKLFHGTLEQCAQRWEGPPFDAVVLNAILEHVPDPDLFMGILAGLTRKGSLLYLDIPHDPNLATLAGNAISRLRRRPEVYNIAPTWPPFHIYGFNKRSLGKLLSKHGFAIRDVRRWNDPRIFSDGTARDAMAARAVTLINHLANVTHTSGNMYVWAQRV